MLLEIFSQGIVILDNGFWTSCSQDETTRVIDEIENAGGECFERDKVRVSQFFECPYPAYNAYKLTFSGHWAQNSNDAMRKFLISEGSSSIALIKRPDATDDVPTVVCLHNTSEFIHGVNFSLNLKLTPQTVSSYVALFGQVVHADHGSFYFVTNECQIPGIAEGSDVALNLKTIIEGIFGKNEEGQYRLNISEKSYRGLGKAFTLDIPTVYSGVLFSTDMRVAENGFITMDEDDPTAIEGLSEFMPPSPYYRIDNSDETVRWLKSGLKRVRRPILQFGVTQAVEKVVGVFALPTISLFFFIALAFGLSNVVVFEFFELLSTSSFLTWTAFLVGGLMVLASIVRFIFLNIAKLVATYVPNRTSMMQQMLQMQTQAARKKLGTVWFIILYAIEFVAIPFIGSAILIFGALNIFYIEANVNFIEALLFVLTSIPMVPYMLVSVYDFDGSVGLYSAPNYIGFSWAVWTFFSTIVLGVVLRLFSLSREP